VCRPRFIYDYLNSVTRIVYRFFDILLFVDMGDTVPQSTFEGEGALYSTSHVSLEIRSGGESELSLLHSPSFPSELVQAESYRYLA